MTSVSIIVPCRNEKAHIRKFLDGLLRQDFSNLDWEATIADGDSTDGTAAIILEYAVQNPRIRMISNPEKIVSTGLNQAILSTSADVIVRMDVHTTYQNDYVRRCVASLEQSGADCVGGPWRARGSGYLSRAIAAAFRSPFSAGGARSHNVSYEGPVDTVYLGCWRRSTLIQLGLFDEKLVRNQDDELNLRITQSGGKVWQSADIISWYCPRSSLRALARQYFQYGFWKVAVIRKHKRPASIRHLVPGLFVGGLGLLLTVTPVATLLGATAVAVVALLLFCLAVTFYLTALIAASIITGVRDEPAAIPVLPFVFGCFHIGYGSGFLYGLWHWRNSSSVSPGRAVTELTR